MIAEGILNLLFGLVKAVIKLLPASIFTLPQWFTDFSSLVSIGLSFFPSDVFYVAIGNIAIWVLLHITWAVIEWIYKKFPGIN